jgi:WD40 repeat protein
MNRSLPCSVLLLILAPSAWAADETTVPDYNTHIAPLFNKYCTACHSADDAEGGLVLESYEKLLAGGRRGVSVVAGKSDQSRLLLVLDGRAQPVMPPEGNEGPKPEEIALVKAWIDAGAKSPTGALPDPTVLVTPKIKPQSPPPSPIKAAAFSPDGKWLALAGYGQVRLLSAATQKRARELIGIRGNVNDVAFSADGSRLVAAAGEAGLFGEVSIWNTSDGTLVRTIVGHRDSLYAAALSPDRRLLATGSYDEQVRLWDAADGKELKLLAGHNGAIFSLSFHPKGRWLASASADRTVKLWNVATGERLDTLGQSLKELYCLAFSPDGKRLAAAGVDNRIRVWEISPTAREGTNPLLVSRFAHEGPIIGLAWSPDGKHLVSAAEDRTVKLWQAESVTERFLLEPQSDMPTAVAFAPDSRTFVIGRLDGTFTLYDVRTGQPASWSVGSAQRGVTPKALHSKAQGAALGTGVSLTTVVQRPKGPLPKTSQVAHAPIIGQRAVAHRLQHQTPSTILGIRAVPRRDDGLSYRRAEKPEMPFPDGERCGGSRPHLVQPLADDLDCKPGSGDQSQLVGANQGGRRGSGGICLAEWLRSVFSEPVERAASEAVYRQSGRTPQAPNVSGRVPRTATTPRNRVRRAICLGLATRSACGALHGYGPLGLDPIKPPPRAQGCALGFRVQRLRRCEIQQDRQPIEIFSDTTFIPPLRTPSLVQAAPSILAVFAAFLADDKPTAKKQPPPKPELTSLAPRGAQRGVATKVTLRGKHLAGATEIKFNHPQLYGRLLSAPKQADSLEIEVLPAADLPRGAYEVSVVTPGGITGVLKLFVDDLVQIDEAEPNNTADSASASPLPASFWGTISVKGDIDHYAFEARAGQTIVFDVHAAVAGSKLDAVLTLLDAEGRALDSSNDFAGERDPLLAYTIPADGRCTVRVGDLLLNGSAEHFYRLSVGTFPYVTACYPLSVPAGSTSEVELVGHNLPSGLKVSVKAGAAGELPVPLAGYGFRSRRELKVAVGSLPELLEAEPNDTPEKAMPMKAPGTVGGRIWAKGSGVFFAGGETNPLATTAEPAKKTPDPVDAASPDIDLFRFESPAGKTWIIETDAARRGSPLDTKIEVLDAQGRPIERLLLQAVRDSYITFRGIDSLTVDARVKNWEEMELNELLYMQGEVSKIFRMPQGPDSGFNFYALGGKRRCYFDTSATTHAMDEPCYIVEPHPPGTTLVPNGLPVFPLHYENDDDGERKLGSDSRLTFTAPADGAYLVRVSDVRDLGGDRFAYRLTVREPKPDFTVRLAGANPTVNAGSGRGLTFTADRVDGFDGEIALDISGLPPGFTVSSPLVIQAGHVEAKAVLHAAADAPALAAENASQVKITARANIDGREVVKDVNPLGRITLVGKPNLRVYLEPAELAIAPGTTITATLRVERNGFNDRIQFSVDNLPHGVIVDNIGLNGVLIPEGQTQRQIFLTAAKWVPETTRPFHAVATNAGGQASATVLLHVRKLEAVAAEDVDTR